MKTRRITHLIAYGLISIGIALQQGPDGQPLTHGYLGLTLVAVFASAMAFINLGLAVAELCQEEVI